MTRAERLAKAEANTKAALAKKRTRLGKIQRAQRKDARQTLARRRGAVGKQVEQAGLFVFDDATLAGLIAALAPLTHMPDPVAVLASLLCESEGLALEAVDGTALPCGQGSALCAD